VIATADPPADLRQRERSQSVAPIHDELPGEDEMSITPVRNQLRRGYLENAAGRGLDPPQPGAGDLQRDLASNRDLHVGNPPTGFVKIALKCN
jgi:hypothetical protein